MSRYTQHLERVQQRKIKLQSYLSTIFQDNHHSCILEIGCGHGDFLVAYAQQFPHSQCLGIDILGGRIQSAQKKANRLNINNTLHFLKAEAIEVLECLPSYTKLENIFILFPDPWPKRKHFERRILQADFLERLRPKMQPQAKIFFRTDHTEYFSWALEGLKKLPQWSVSENAPWPIEVVTRFQLITGGVYQSMTIQSSIDDYKIS